MCVVGTPASQLIVFFFLFSQGLLQQLRQMAGRMSAGGAGPRGPALGAKLLIGAGALAYGVKEATYTGSYHWNYDAIYLLYQLGIG